MKTSVVSCQLSIASSYLLTFGHWLFVSIYNAAARQVVWRQLNRHPVAGKYANKVLAHLARDVRQHLVLVLQFHLEHGIGQGFNHHRHYLNRVFLTHSTPSFSCQLSVFSYQLAQLACYQPATIPVASTRLPRLIAAQPATDNCSTPLKSPVHPWSPYH